LLVKYGFCPKEYFGVLLAELQDKIVGLTSFTINFSIWSGCHLTQLDDVFVEDAYRCFGIDKKLLPALKTEGLRKGYYRIRWEVEKENLKAIQFYQ